MMFLQPGRMDHQAAGRTAEVRADQRATDLAAVRKVAAAMAAGFEIPVEEAIRRAVELADNMASHEQVLEPQAYLPCLYMPAQ